MVSVTDRTGPGCVLRVTLTCDLDLKSGSQVMRVNHVLFVSELL